jgi:hypothetical protein
MAGENPGCRLGARLSYEAEVAHTALPLFVHYTLVATKREGRGIIDVRRAPGSIGGAERVYERLRTGEVAAREGEVGGPRKPKLRS